MRGASGAERARVCPVVSAVKDQGGARMVLSGGGVFDELTVLHDAPASFAHVATTAAELNEPREVAPCPRRQG